MASKIKFICSTASTKTQDEVEVSIALPADAASSDISGNLQVHGNKIETLTFIAAGGGLYKAKFVPQYVGRYNLTMSYCGAPCSNSPMTLLVAPRGELKATLVGGPEFNNPHDIVEFGCRFLITNKGSHDVIVTDRYGFRTNKFILPSLSNSQSFEPFAIAVQDQLIMVSDVDNGRVVVYNQDGIPMKQIGEEYLQGPTGVVIDEDKKIYVADNTKSCVWVFDTNGNLIKTIGWEGSKPGELNKPWFIALNSKRQLVVADCQNCRIQIFNSITGELVNCFKVQLDCNDMYVRGLAVDRHDVIYITAITKTRRPKKKVECVMAITGDGTVLGHFGSAVYRGIGIIRPSEVSRGIRIMDEDGESVAYVVEGGNHRILVYKL